MGPARPSRTGVRTSAPTVAVLAVLLVAGGWWLAQRVDSGGAGASSARPETGAASSRVAPEEGARAPDFTATDGEGHRFHLSDYRGRAILVNFWATWCVACRAEIPAIQAAYADHRSEGFEVIAVNEEEDVAAAQGFLQDLGADFRLALDPDGSIARLYGVIGLPASFFVDRDGVIRRVWPGEMAPEQVEGFTHEALGLKGAESEGTTAAPITLTVLLDPEGPGTLYLLSPAIRCDADYCANNLLLAVHAVPAVLEARGAPQAEGGAVAIFVRFDPAVGGPGDVVAAFRDALRRRPDPVLGGEVAVRYLAPVEDGTPAP